MIGNYSIGNAPIASNGSTVFSVLATFILKRTIRAYEIATWIIKRSIYNTIETSFILKRTIRNYIIDSFIIIRKIYRIWNRIGRTNDAGDFTRQARVNDGDDWTKISKNNT